MERVIHSVEKEIAGRTLKIETGRMARQADGAVTVQYGDTVVFVGTTIGPTSRLDFFPMTVDYRENTYAAGKFPGGFFKREGRPTTKEILSARLADRSNRPLFPKGYKCEVSVQSLVLSADLQNDPDVLSMIGTAATLALSKAPYFGPAAGVRVARVGEEFVLFPTQAQLDGSSLDLVVSGTMDALLMVEAGGWEIPEEVMLDALDFAHQAIREINQMILDLCEKAGKPFSLPEATEAAAPASLKEIREKYLEEFRTRNVVPGKHARKNALNELQETIRRDWVKRIDDDPAFLEDIETSISIITRDVIREQILREKKRHDGRGLAEIRPISVETALLPRCHGSALFTRGETQALVTTTLGTAMDEQKIDGLIEPYNKKFMLHYNFPAYCVGETWPNRGPKRREIGHGVLAERALTTVLPEPREFPYTVRLVSQVMESNGSSSMATVCGGTLALMDAGVPIRRPVAGIAMGLVKEGDDVRVLSDISGSEDANGDMDFKVAGSQVGITALQMDIKTKGISRKVLAAALEQAREGRLHILRAMLDRKVGGLDRPREYLSPHAPRLVQLPIVNEKIGMLIGPGGKNIRRIQEETGTSIEIDDANLTVTIVGYQAAHFDRALHMVKGVIEDAEIGRIYEGKVVSIKDFGAFVEIAPGQEGLCHISELAEGYVNSVSEHVSIGDTISVKVIDIDGQNRIKLSKRAAERELAQPRAD